MTTTLHTKSNRLSPAGPHELSDEIILCNDITLPGDFNPHNTRLWVIGNEFGALGAVWASCEQDALDELCDAGLSAGLSCDEPEDEDEDEEITSLGNAGEPHDLTYCWMGEVEFIPERDWRLLCRFAEARGNGADNLYQ